MIPKVHNWRVTFHKVDGDKVSVVVTCVKRFAKMIANEQLGYPAIKSNKVTVGLVS